MGCLVQDHINRLHRDAIKPEEVFFLDDWPENVVQVRDWGATALLFGQDVHTYKELLEMLK